jgi:hypothetical protein
MFLPFILFYFWAARYERHPEEHGLFGGNLIGQRAGNDRSFPSIKSQEAQA